MRFRILAGLLTLGLTAFAQEKAAPPPAAVDATNNTAAEPAPHKHVRLAGFSVGAGYSAGPAWYPGYYGRGYFPAWGYDPFFYSPYIHPGFYYGYPYGPDRGAVKLAPTAAKSDAGVYLDGAYAGQASKIKTMWLEPGIYNLELRSANATTYQKRIYVLTGKTLKLDPSEVR